MRTPCIFNKKIIFAATLIFLLTLSAKSQNRNFPTQDNFWSHVRFGGGVGLGFGDGWFSGTLAPSAIYEFNHQFALGAGLSATYAKHRDEYNATILGGSLIGLFNPIPEIQLSAELEEAHVNRNFELDGLDLSDNYWVPSLFLGAGYRTQNITFGVKYNVLHDEEKSIYADAIIPFVRVYF